MTPEQFCYWLQGRVELLPDQAPTPTEWQMIREHLATVFHKVTPGTIGPERMFTPNPVYPNVLDTQTRCVTQPQVATRSIC